jgi:hypothetical protein
MMKQCRRERKWTASRRTCAQEAEQEARPASANGGPVVLSNNRSGGPLAADCGTSGGGARRNGGEAESRPSYV